MMEPVISMEIVQEDMDVEADQLLTECLNTPEIVRTVLQHIHTSELFQLSLVNKSWNFEARRVLRDRRSLTKTLNTHQTCQDLRRFALDLQSMKESMHMFPLSGLTICLGGSRWTHGVWCNQPSTAGLHQAYEDTLKLIRWRHLSVLFASEWTDKCQNCPGFLLVKKILSKFGSVLEDLTLELPENHGRRLEFIQQFIQDCCPTLPSLKILSIGHSTAGNQGSRSFIKEMIVRVPNLRVLRTLSLENLNENRLEGSNAIHVTGYPYSPSENEIPEAVAGELKMEQMNLFNFSHDSSLERFNRITSMVLQISRLTLSSMSIDVFFLVPLMAYGICLENVRKLRMDVNGRKLEFIQPQIWQLVKRFDFTRTFPSLNVVTINYSYLHEIPDEFNAIIEQGNAALMEPLPDRAVHIKKLQIELLPVAEARRDGCFQLLAQMFPAIQKLSILTSDIPVSQIRDIWADLKEVHVKLFCSDIDITNFDSEICGIFSEEVAQLQGQDEEYLRSVNIVPVKPSVAYVQELRTFTVAFNGSYFGPMDDPTCIFSKVTGLIAFQRSPALTVTVATRDERHRQALSHLTPYASVVSEKNGPMISFFGR